MESRKPMTLGRKWVLDIAAFFGGLLVLAILRGLMHEMGLVGFWPAAIRTTLVLGPVFWVLAWTNSQYEQYKMTLKNQSEASDLSGEASPTRK